MVEESDLEPGEFGGVKGWRRRVSGRFTDCWAASFSGVLVQVSACALPVGVEAPLELDNSPLSQLWGL